MDVENIDRELATIIHHARAILNVTVGDCHDAAQDIVDLAVQVRTEFETYDHERRERIASSIAAMIYGETPEVMAQEAVRRANALIRELNRSSRAT